MLQQHFSITMKKHLSTVLTLNAAKSPVLVTFLLPYIVNSLWPSDGWYMVTEIWVNIGSGDDLLPDGTKPLPELMFIYDQ